MLAIRRNSVSPLKTFFDMSRELENFFNNAYGEFASEAVFTPSIDIYSEEDALVVKADLPGVKEDDIEITVNDGVLTIKGQREEEKTEKAENCVRSERVFGSFMRQFTLPKQVDVDKIKATFNNGVLEINLPYSETAKEKKIAIEKK
jgi:HSP20 family protein